jgi:Protein of unknown function (DUF3987)
MTYNIRDHIEILTPTKGSRTKYHCPVCNGHNLDIQPATGIYGCFSGGCSPTDIRAAIDQLEGKPPWKPDSWTKPTRPKSQQEYFYPSIDDNPLIRVVRIDNGDGTKTFYQNHWNGKKWEKGTPTEIRTNIHIYRYQEVRQAIERGQSIYWVEGEKLADLLWGLGIPATTTLGGSSGYSSYGNYQNDLIGARLILAPDRDSNGIKYIAKIERDFPNQIEGYYLAGTPGLWKNPQGGMDIGDEIQDLGFSQDKVISPAAYQAIRNVGQQPTNNPTIDIRQKLKHLVNTDLEKSEIEIRLNQVAQTEKSSVCALKKILNEIEAEADRDEQRPELKIEIDRLTTAKSTSVNIHQVLPPSLAKPIEMLANSLGHNVEPYLLYLLAGTGGVLHAESFIQLRTGYQQPGNLYGGVIAASGSMKSPVQKQMLTKPLAKLQQEYNERYTQEWAQYEIDVEIWKPDSGEPKPIAPHHHVVYTNNMTMEAVDVIASKQPEQSAIYIKDELKAIFMSANQYRQGDDIQTYLSRYDGEQLSRIRTGSGFISSNHDIKFTMVGTIQPGVISKLSENADDDDGLMSRFLFSNLNCKFVPMTEEGGVDVVDLIANNYNKVHQLPASIYKLNPEAFKKFTVEFDRLRVNSLDTSRKGWERNVWSKAGGQLGRLILNLHLIWLINDVGYHSERRQQIQQMPLSSSRHSDESPTNRPTIVQQCPTIPTIGFRLDTIAYAAQSKIPPETVERAIELIRYFVDQSIGLIAEQSGELSPQLAQILELSKKKGSITPRIIIQFSTRKNRPASTKQALELLKELTAMGYGKLNKEGRTFIFTPNNTTNNVGLVGQLLVDLLVTESVAPTELDPIVGFVGHPPLPCPTIDQIDPKPPTIDRPIPEFVKFSDYVEYQVVGDRCEWIHIAFHSYKIARAWESQMNLWGGQADKPVRISRNGKKFMLRVINLKIAYLEQILAADLGQAPKQTTHR